MADAAIELHAGPVTEAMVRALVDLFYTRAHADPLLGPFFAATIPDLEFAPGVHVNYQETVLHIHDGLPKMKDMPKEMGGSGVALPE